MPDNAYALAEWLSGIRGSRVTVRVPERGDKRSLQETVTRNAGQAFQLHKLRRAGDLSARSKALGEIQDALAIADAPLRIECFDISNLQGTSVVGSMVVFEDGLARKSEYRRFAIRNVEGQDDTAAMYEVIHRRFARYTDERDKPPANEAEGEKRRFAYPPNLVVVDGGPPQVAAAARAMDELGVVDVSLCGLAKRLEEVWLPDRDEPVIMPRTSEGLYLLQRVRDEAHRFAIAYHRQKRSRSMTTSALDNVPGLGDTRRKALLKHFGSVKRLRAATPDEIAQVPGIGPKTAVTIAAALAATVPTPAVDPATGEILEAAES
jgi:excinuclease ABC subunit C